MNSGGGMKIGAKLYIGAILAAGLVCFVHAMAGWTCREPLHYLCDLSIALAASGLKVFLPGVNGNMSVSYFFVLLSMMDFSYPETVVLACLSIAVQTLWRPRSRPKLLHLLFNLASVAVAVSAGCAIYRLSAGWGQVVLSIAISSTAYFL